MLVLGRETDEKIVIVLPGLEIEVCVVESKFGAAKIGIKAPKFVKVHREEIWKEKQAEEKKIDRHNYDEESDTANCLHCQGTGRRKHECEANSCKLVEGHRLNVEDYRSSYSNQGYCIKQCSICKRVWGVRYQWDAGTGSDDHWYCFGVGDPVEIATKRHY